MHYYQHHIGDFIKATARLTDGQTMAYLRLLWLYYDSEKPLKPDIRVLAFQIGASQEDTELLLKSFFVLEETGWHQKRCDQEIADYRDFLNKKSNAGKASAERRRIISATDDEQVGNGRSTGVEQVLNGCATDVQLTTNQQPLTINHKPKRKNATVVATPDGVSQEVFESFLVLRKAKNAPVTLTAISGIGKEARIAGLSLEEALAMCCARGWTGFKAKWTVDQVNAADSRQATMTALTRGLSTPKPFWAAETIEVQNDRLL